MLIRAQRYLEIHDRRVSYETGFVISTQLERQAPGVKRWPASSDCDHVLGGLFCTQTVVVVVWLSLPLECSRRGDEWGGWG